MTLTTIADEIERYLRTGDADMMGYPWPGDLRERGRRQHADLRGALVEEVRCLAKGRTHEPLPDNVGVEFTRVDPVEVASIVAEAANSRNGWKVILRRCAPNRKPRSINAGKVIALANSQ